MFPDVSLEGDTIVCVQHVLSSTISLFNALFEKGLKPERLFVLGKCYSTRPDAITHLSSIGVHVSTLSSYFDPYEPFDVYFKNNLAVFWNQTIIHLKQQEIKRLIILDDGGELLSLMNLLIEKEPCFKDKIIGIEQTTAGYEKLKKQSLSFPIINVARSDVKLFHESPFVAKVAIERMFHHLNGLGLSPQNALIVGAGAVGSQVADQLNGCLEVQTFDLKSTRSTLSDGRQRLKDFDLIIGCTGSSVLYPEDFSLLKTNACLVSVSSSDREFNAVFIRKNKANIMTCHDNIYAQDLYLLNCGFPINFDEAYDEIDPLEFQLTRGILLAAIYQSVSQEKDVGLIDLEQHWQKEIYTIYHQILLDRLKQKVLPNETFSNFSL
ncbi:MAG: hypothetical protein ACOVOR_04525 [Rhabdochlamydiaceae bacterium]